VLLVHEPKVHGRHVGVLLVHALPHGVRDEGGGLSSGR
jgi:hypothetical protein